MELCALNYTVQLLVEFWAARDEICRRLSLQRDTRMFSHPWFVFTRDWRTQPLQTYLHYYDADDARMALAELAIIVRPFAVTLMLHEYREWHRRELELMDLDRVADNFLIEPPK
jgi:hypothetical protein